ncbi:MAG: hypothetical protein LBC64_01755 [Fibromonadaceae bacterium]|jgi:hypothetical protein|nr:hypothetical protein [Fibromonadaceae bacterium]
MNIEIPSELLLPTVEELERRTVLDMEKEWKPCKRPGKKERAAIKKENDTAKLQTITKELDKPKQTVNSLSSLFAKNERTKFSLSDVNTDSPIKPKQPTLRVSLGSASSKPAEPDIQNRKRGRPPKVKSL